MGGWYCRGTSGYGRDPGRVWHMGGSVPLPHPDPQWGCPPLRKYRPSPPPPSLFRNYRAPLPHGPWLRQGPTPLIEIGGTGAGRSIREGSPPQGLSEARRGNVVFQGSYSSRLIRRGGAPSGAAGFIAKGVWGHQPPSRYPLTKTILEENRIEKLPIEKIKRSE